MSEALIDMRLTFRRAERQGVLSPDLRAILVDAARRLHFLDRSYAAVFEEAEAGLPFERRESLLPLAAWVEDHAVRQKSRDALGLLRHMAGHPAERAAVPPFRMTEAWAADLDAAGLTVHHAP